MPQRPPEPEQTRIGSNAGKKLANTTPGPWTRWKTKDRAERAIRFIETYCRAPKGYGHGKPLKLAEFQKQWLREVFADGVTSAVMSVGRGNGKSTFLAALGLWALFDPDESGAPQIPIIATTVGQAQTSVYGVALAMVRSEWELESRCHIYTAIGASKIVTPMNHGEMFPRASDPDTLQGLDPSLAICDEVGFVKVQSWDSLLLASGKRPRSLVVGIGTPGFDRDNALWHLRERAMSGRIPEGFVYREYSADEDCDVRDESQWRKANPALDEGYMNISALRTAVDLSPEGHFRIFRLGQWHEGVECWLGDDGRKVWDECCDPQPLLEGAPTWLGIDVALKHDSTAVVMAQQRPDGRLHVKAKVWEPRPDGRLDVADVMGYIRELGRLVDLRECAFDPRFFDLPAQILGDEGYPMVEFSQALERMTPAVGATYEAIKRHELSHDGDLLFTSQVLNAVARLNERGFTLAKSKSRGRIDSAVAMCMAVSRALARPEQEPETHTWVMWG